MISFLPLTHLVRHARAPRPSALNGPEPCTPAELERFREDLRALNREIVESGRRPAPKTPGSQARKERLARLRAGLE